MDKNHPKISVIMPVYNVAKYLPRCLDSIILQTYDNLEIICVNDGSTDNSPTILKDYAARDKRIQIITQKNQGLSGARNIGMKAMSGDYFTFIDSDDWLQLGAYQKFVNILKKEKQTIDIFIFNGLNYWQETRTKEAKIDKVSGIKGWGDFKQSHLKTFRENKNPLGIAMAAWNKLYRRDWFQKYDFQFPQGKIFEDRIFNAHACLAAGNIYVLEDYLYCYRRQNQSICFTLNENIFDILTVNDEVKQVYKDHNFFEQNKLSFLKYMLQEIMLAFISCRQDLRPLFLQESRQRLQVLIAELGKDTVEQNEHHELIDDILHLNENALYRKYQQIDAGTLQPKTNIKV